MALLRRQCAMKVRCFEPASAVAVYKCGTYIQRVAASWTASCTRGRYLVAFFSPVFLELLVASALRKQCHFEKYFELISYLTRLGFLFFVAQFCWNEAEKKKHVPEQTLNWAAFFGDVEHSVERVTSGHRITLTYILYRDSAPDPNVDVLLQRASSLHTALSDALRDDTFLEEGGTIAYRCRHL